MAHDNDNDNDNDNDRVYTLDTLFNRNHPIKVLEKNDELVMLTRLALGCLVAATFLVAHGMLLDHLALCQGVITTDQRMIPRAVVVTVISGIIAVPTAKVIHILKQELTKKKKTKTNKEKNDDDE